MTLDASSSGTQFTHPKNRDSNGLEENRKVLSPKVSIKINDNERYSAWQHILHANSDPTSSTEGFLAGVPGVLPDVSLLTPHSGSLELGNGPAPVSASVWGGWTTPRPRAGLQGEVFLGGRLVGRCQPWGACLGTRGRDLGGGGAMEIRRSLEPCGVSEGSRRPHLALALGKGALVMGAGLRGRGLGLGVRPGSLEAGLGELAPRGAGLQRPRDLQFGLPAPQSLQFPLLWWPRGPAGSPGVGWPLGLGAGPAPPLPSSVGPRRSGPR